MPLINIEIEYHCPHCDEDTEDDTAYISSHQIGCYGPRMDVPSVALFTVHCHDCHMISYVTMDGSTVLKELKK